MTGGLFDRPVPRFDSDPTGHGGEGRATMAGRVARFFKARPGQWIDGRGLMTIAGSYGWRTRVSDIRRTFVGVLPMTRDRGRSSRRRVGCYAISEYMYVLPDANRLGGAA